ncbi:hypothetical protein C5167_016909 [Papaver somniferum]|uniref:Uncharacterized protein n=1 Tax=Papaver somniferum TaxID=3469 RepID=A0A4Y7IL72_PAPSO|nr:hypothetical protein C5167_016909 [Papaver somniferum]
MDMSLSAGVVAVDQAVAGNSIEKATGQPAESKWRLLQRDCSSLKGHLFLDDLETRSKHPSSVLFSINQEPRAADKSSPPVQPKFSSLPRVSTPETHGDRMGSQ